MAQYYHILDWRSVSLLTLSKLVVGLPADSRISMKLSGQKMTTTEYLLASIFDQVNLILWSKTKDGARGVNRPKSLVKMVKGEEGQKDHGLAFASGEEYEEARKELLDRIGVN